MWRGHPACSRHTESFTHLGGMARTVPSVHISSGNSHGPCRTLFHRGLFSTSKACRAKSGCVRARALITRVILLCCGCVWHSDKGEVTVGLVTARGERAGLQTVVSCWGCSIWSIEPRVSARRGKCAQAKWTYSTWRAYRSVFTCLLSQVVQTGRLPFPSDSGHVWFQSGTSWRDRHRDMFTVL